jgi:hypothetical protein
MTWLGLDSYIPACCNPVEAPKRQAPVAKQPVKFKASPKLAAQSYTAITTGARIMELTTGVHGSSTDPVNRFHSAEQIAQQTGRPSGRASITSGRLSTTGVPSEYLAQPPFTSQTVTSTTGRYTSHDDVSRTATELDTSTAVSTTMISVHERTSTV